jgi:3',5'-cyclic AMP phosphodiesterase CpdA
MPIHLPSRRQFLGASAALLLARAVDANAKPDPHRFALLSDVHIHADKTNKTGNTVMWDTMAQAVREITALDPLPNAAIVDGDCAYFYGKPEDYAAFIEAIDPLRKAGLPVHLTLGNHDHRGNFLAAVKSLDSRVKDNAVDDRVVSVIESPRANLILLDTLDKTDRVQGVLGKSQLAWLAAALDARKDKPAILFIHHNPDVRPANKRNGLDDTTELYDIILPRRQVKAVVFGHTHVWNHSKRDGIHLINLPPTAWLFMPALPQGWVDLRLNDNGATFELVALKKEHHLHGEKIEATWR